MRILKENSFIRFIIVGGSSTFIDFVIYMLLSIFMPTYISKGLSMLVSSVYSFLLNRKWTFKSLDTRFITKFLYCIVVIINIVVNILVNSFILLKLDSKIFAFIVATGVAMLVNYILQRKVVFKEAV